MLNPYLSVHTTGYAPTHTLYESMIIENIQISGQSYIYIPRTLSTRFDRIFGEDVLSSFESHADIEMYLLDYSGYGGESEMLSKFGMETRDTASFVISRKRYAESVMPIVPQDRDEKLKWRPCEGDLIYVPFSKSLFELKFVEDEFPGFYQLNKKFVWVLRCELVQLNNESFNTGLTEVDDMFGTNDNRLSYGILTESDFAILTETGGVVLSEDQQTNEPVDDIRGYGDNQEIKKEFLAIANWSSDNPFSEKF